MNYLEKTDEELISLSKNDAEALGTLLFRYKPLVKSIARRFINYDDLGDLIQEGMIALNSAIGNYSKDKAASFKTFSNICITRRLYNVVRGNLSDKNRAITLSSPLDNAMGIIGQDLERDYINKESEHAIWAKIDEVLTKEEKEVFTLYLDGLSYLDISKKTGLSSKKVDNTLQKIKKTLKKSLIV